MKRTKQSLLASQHLVALTLLPITLLPLLAGCGGGGHAALPSTPNSATNRAQGTVHFTVKWPEPSRLIPARAQKITLVLTAEYNNTGEPKTIALGEKDVTRDQPEATFDAVPEGSAHLVATAYPDPASGSINAQATGEVDFEVAKDKTTEIGVTMATTITKVAVVPQGNNGPAPDRVSVKFHQSRAVTATAYDASGNIVLTPPDQWKWSSKDAATVALTATGETATITGAAAGSTDLTVTEGESGVTGTTHAQVATYDVIELAPIAGSDNSAANAINDNGAVFGVSGPFVDALGNSDYRPAFWSTPGAAANDLGGPTLLGGIYGYFQSVEAVTMNNAGTAVGTINFQSLDYTVGAASVSEPFTSINGAPATVGPQPPGYAGNFGYGKAVTISNDGRLLVNAVSFQYYYGTSDSEEHDAVYILANGTGLPGFTLEMGQAIKMNNNLQVIGYTKTYADYDIAKPILIDAKTNQTTMLPAGMVLSGINDAGVIAGTNADSKPVLLPGDGSMTMLPLLDGDTTGDAKAINAAGWVIGKSGGKLVLWRDGKVFDLDTRILTDQGWTLDDISGINSHGQIVGSGTHNGKKRGFILNPLDGAN